MGTDTDLHHGHLIARRILVIVGADRHRRADFQGLFRQVVLGLQIAAHRSADHRDHDVVDRRTGKGLADFLDVRQRKFPPVKHPVRAQLLVEAGLRNAALCIVTLAKFPLHVEQALGHRDQLLQILQASHRIGDIVELRLGKQRDRIGILFRLELHVELARFHLGIKVVQRQRHLQSGLAIDRGMVHLVQHREAALGHALDIVEPLNHRIFPERLVHVHRPRIDARRLDAQLPPVTRLRQGDMADVIFKIEIRVIDPIGMIQIERHPHQLLPEYPGAVEASLDIAQYVLEADHAAGRGRGIVDQQLPDMHRRVRRFRIGEHRIQCTQLLHRNSLPLLLLRPA